MSDTTPYSRKPILGLVGAIGAGKSTAAVAMARRGAAVIDADRIGHDVLDLPAVKAALVERWGPRVLRPDGHPDRRVIAGIVFPDPAERKALEAIVFPPITDRVRERIAAANVDPTVRFVALDAAVMLEAGWNGVCDRIVYIDAPREVRVARLAARSGWTAEDLAAREAAQMPADEKKMRADAIVTNDGNSDRLQQQVDDLLRRWGVLSSAE